jgi:hypothetical protein
MGSFTVTIANLQKLPEVEPIPMYDEFGLAKCRITCGPETCHFTCGELSCGHTVGGDAVAEAVAATAEATTEARNRSSRQRRTASPSSTSRKTK